MNHSARAYAGRDALSNPENSVLLLVDHRAFRFSNEIGRGRNGLACLQRSLRSTVVRRALPAFWKRNFFPIPAIRTDPKAYLR